MVKITNILSFALFIVFTFVLPVHSDSENKDLRHVRLQLKWTNQFQFAGYYMAKEKGYYRDVGLDVELLPGGRTVNVTDQVLSGKADFGVGTSELILDYAAGKPVVVLGVIYQHSPLVLIDCHDKSQLSSIREMAEKPIAMEPNSKDLFAMLRKNGINLSELKLVDHIENIQNFTGGYENSVFSAYLTDEPYTLDEKGINYTVYSPRTYGIDFYGDNFFTRREMVKDHYKLVKAFRNATVLGWQAALKNPQKAVELIIEKYPGEKSRAELLYEAKTTDELMTHLVEPGFMLPNRWKSIAATYIDLGMLNEQPDLDKFILWFDDSVIPVWVIVIFAVGLLFILFLLIFASYFKSFNVRLKREVDFRRKIERKLVTLYRELEQEKERAEELSRDKTLFIANVSHDLRAPVCSIISLSNIFLHNVKTLDLPEKFIRFLGQLHSGSEFLQLMLNNILDYSAFEMNSATVVVEKIELNEWCESIVGVIEPQADLRKVTLNIAVNSVSSIIESDISRLSQILLNLTHNAIKFSPDGGNIHIFIVATDATLEVTVSDSGPGISSEDQKKIFKTFYTTSRMESNYYGKGIGLSIVKRNVDLMKGRVSVANVDGGGAEFKVVIPLEKQRMD